jgi:hypothetical protein
MHLGRLGRAASRSWTPATLWRLWHVWRWRGGSENGHQGLASSGAGALKVEVALASGAGAGGGRSRSPELSGGVSGERQSRAEQSRAAGGGRRGPGCKCSKVQGALCKA